VSYYNILIFLQFVLLLFSSETDSASDRVRLRDITALTLQSGMYTTGRRSAPVSQLKNTGGTASGKFVPKVVQCYNRGFDGKDVQWECVSEMSADYKFGRIDVSCEGYDYPDDEYILAGSCGLQYELDYTAHGLKTGTYLQQKNYGGFFDGFKFNPTTLILLAVVVFVIYTVYCAWTAQPEGIARPAGSGGSGGGHPPPDDGPPPPYGWGPSTHRPPPPSYDQSSRGKGSSGSGSTSTDSGGPGFFTGLGLGALGGYLFGGSGNGSSRRRTGFGYGSGFGSDYSSSYYDGPSTSSSYFSSGGSSSPSTSSSSSTHKSSGYGGTSRR